MSANTTRTQILEAIEDERRYQIERWGTSDDDLNTPADFIAYINRYGTNWLNGEFRPFDEATMYRFHDSMIKVAAIAVAAAEYSGKIINGELSRPDVMKAD